VGATFVAWFASNTLLFSFCTSHGIAEKANADTTINPTRGNQLLIHWVNLLSDIGVVNWFNANV
jgi:hypothetical protein